MNTRLNKLIIKGAKQNNLTDVDVVIPHDALTVVTGVSGSGKSSLVFETIYAEGQRRYVESLSSYARQFLGRMPKPEVDVIEGLAPAIAIEQKVMTRNPRSTVATTTEIYDYLKLLFARMGELYSPISGQKVTRETTEDVVQYLLKNQHEQNIIILTKPSRWLGLHDVNLELSGLLTKGYLRIMSPELEFIRLDKLTSYPDNLSNYHVVIDNIYFDANEAEVMSRTYDSIENAYWEGNGNCTILIKDTDLKIHFNDSLSCDGMMFTAPDINNLSFNNPAGACKHCGGLGEVIDINPDLIIPNPSLSVYDDCVMPWRGETMREWKKSFMTNAIHRDFPIHRAYEDLNQAELDLLWNGYKKIKGIRDFFHYLESKSYKIQYRVMMSRYRGRTVCPECKGTKLAKEAGYVKLKTREKHPLLHSDKVSMHDLLLMQINEACIFFDEAIFENQHIKATDRILLEIKNRLSFLNNVGLGYLTLHRMSNTLSGGESQRIRLSTSIGSPLTGSLYILDEPSIGLHQKDTHQLIQVLKELRDKGNTVIVVEHDEEMMKAADYLIDIGPGAGKYGGQITFSGTYLQMPSNPHSLTAKYLTGEYTIPIPPYRRKWQNKLTLIGCREHNLQNIDVTFPLETLTMITGVSGSGKTTLIKKILVPAIQRKIGEYSTEIAGKHKELKGDIHLIKNIELIDQNPLGRSSRSNPVTYVKAWDLIRELLSGQPLAKRNQLKPSSFSFNIEGGRCEHCKGDGEITIEMQFMADIKLPCDDCKGRRFKEEVLEITYKEKNVFEILQLSIEEAISFFSDQKNIVERLEPLLRVGLGYVQMGQSTGSLSGGEAQRVKLASFLGKGFTHEPHLFVFDEPTTGLHFHDIVKLIQSLQALVDKGHSVIVIEHNPDMIKVADYVIDLGPDGGYKGGQLMFSGTPEELIQCETSITGHYLKTKFPPTE
jgi:excinuclease ABC subunit A